jgi:hypothetical protein
METSKTGGRAGPQVRAPRSTLPHSDEAQSIIPDELPESLRSQAAEAASPLVADVKDAAKTVSRAVKNKAVEFAANMGHELSQTAETQKTRGVEAIQCFARAITSAADEIEAQSPQAARSVRDAAAKVEGLSRNLSNHSVDDLLGVVTDLARKQPLLFVGGALAAGFAVSRFLRSSANDKPPAETGPAPSAHN